MYKSMITILITILCFSAVSADNHSEWDSFEESERNSPPKESSQNNNNEPSTQNTPQTSNNYKSPDSKFTPEFYIALGVGAIGLLIILFLAYIMIRGPANQFKSKNQ